MSTLNKFKKFRNQLQNTGDDDDDDDEDDDDNNQPRQQQQQKENSNPPSGYVIQVPSDHQQQQRKYSSFQTQQESNQSLEDPRFLGKTLVCCYKNHNPIFTIGPHWPFTACLIGFISIFFFLIIFVASDQINRWITMLSVFLYSLYLLVFGSTAILNPGIPDRNRKLRNNKDFKRCQLCDMIVNKKRSPFHCEDCEICVENFDHHCPWTGKCIGGGNLKCFNLFLVSTAIFIMYCIIIGVTQMSGKGSK